MAVALNPKPAIPNGTYKIRSLARNDLFLALGSLVDDQISMKAIMANAKGAQEWLIEARDDGTFNISNCDYETSLQLKHFAPPAKPLIYGDDSESEDDEDFVWTIEPRDRAFIIGIPDEIRVVNLKLEPKRHISSEASGYFSGEEVTLAQRNGLPAQRWVLELYPEDPPSLPSPSSLSPPLSALRSPLNIEAEWKRAHKSIVAGMYTIRSRATGSTVGVHPHSNTIFVILSPDQRESVLSRLTIGKQVADSSRSGLCVQTQSKMEMSLEAGQVVATPRSNFARFIPVRDAPGWYFISPDMRSKPPKVITNPYESAICGEPLSTAELHETDRSQMWQLVPVM